MYAGLMPWYNLRLYQVAAKVRVFDELERFLAYYACEFLFLRNSPDKQAQA